MLVTEHQSQPTIRSASSLLSNGTRKSRDNSSAATSPTQHLAWAVLWMLGCLRGSCCKHSLRTDRSMRSSSQVFVPSLVPEPKSPR